MGTHLSGFVAQGNCHPAMYGQLDVIVVGWAPAAFIRRQCRECRGTGAAILPVKTNGGPPCCELADLLAGWLREDPGADAAPHPAHRYRHCGVPHACAAELHLHGVSKDSLPLGA